MTQTNTDIVVIEDSAPQVMMNDPITDWTMASLHQKVTNITLGTHYRVITIEDTIRCNVGIRLEETDMTNIIVYVPAPPRDTQN
jgi:penicillin V acylase-like amidase (Ntn superfamily)